MLVLLLAIVLLIAVPVVAGFVTTRRERQADRRHFAALVGFSAGIFAIAATIVSFTVPIVWFRPPDLPYYHPALQGIVFISGSIGIISSGVAFVAGLFCGGIRRVALVAAFAPVIGLIYLLAAFSNFGA
jgi:hypothetical protein